MASAHESVVQSMTNLSVDCGLASQNHSYIANRRFTIRFQVDVHLGIVDKNFRAFAVIIVGSRQILVREMDRHGKWVKRLQLAG